jgi:hypothetical protein
MTGTSTYTICIFQVKNLVEILQKNIKTSDELLDEVADIYIQFAVKKIPNLANKIIKMYVYICIMEGG